MFSNKTERRLKLLRSTKLHFASKLSCIQMLSILFRFSAQKCWKTSIYRIFEELKEQQIPTQELKAMDKGVLFIK